MDYKTIHNYIDDTFHFIGETLSTITYKIQDTSYEITLIPAIGKADQVTRDLIRETIYAIIEEDWSHCVAGAYTIENIESRPENIFVLISHNDNIEFIFNISENRQIIAHSWLFSIFDDPLISTIILDHIVKFLFIFDKSFIFACGLDFSIFLKDTYPYDNISENTVFRLDGEFQVDSITKENEELVIFDGDQNNQRIHLLNDAYDYDLPLDGLMETVRIRPHILCIDTKENKVMSMARINSISKDFAVIGGVETLGNYRRKGLGFKVSYVLTDLVRKRTKNVVLETDNGNFPAIKIYKKIGFRSVGRSIFLDRGMNTIKDILGDRDY